MSGGSLMYLPTKAVDDWDSEKQYYDYSTNSCADGQMCGHYTQNVWAGSTTVGCGVRCRESHLTRCSLLRYGTSHKIDMLRAF